MIGVMRVATLLVVPYFVFTSFASALTPAEPWHTHKIFSANKQFYAQVSHEGKTSIKEARWGWFAKSLWSTPKYFEYALVSDDGSFLVSSSTLITPPFRKDETVVEIYHRDGVKKLKLDLFVDDLGKLQDVMGGLKSFGGATGLDGDWITVDNGAGEIFAVNAKTGKIKLKTEGKRNHSRS